MAYLAKNNAYSTLAGSLTNVATSLTVQTGHGDRFPAVTSPNYTMVTLEDASGNREIVKVTARTAASDLMTIVRAQENTAARSWAAGDIVELRFTAGVMESVINATDMHTADTADAHAASAISNAPTGNLTATTVQGALNELQSDIDARATAAALTAHITDATDVHAASAITNTPSGNLLATTVQGAIDELQSDIDTRVTPAGSVSSLANAGGWNVTPSGTKLFFSYNGVNKGSLDSSGNFIVTGNITAYGTA